MKMLTKDSERCFGIVCSMEGSGSVLPDVGGIEQQIVINGLVTNARSGFGKYELSALASTDAQTLKADQIARITGSNARNRKNMVSELNILDSSSFLTREY